MEKLSVDPTELMCLKLWNSKNLNALPEKSRFIFDREVLKQHHLVGLDIIEHHPRRELYSSKLDHVRHQKVLNKVRKIPSSHGVNEIDPERIAIREELLGVPAVFVAPSSKSGSLSSVNRLSNLNLCSSKASSSAQSLKCKDKSPTINYCNDIPSAQEPTIVVNEVLSSSTIAVLRKLAKTTSKHCKPGGFLLGADNISEGTISFLEFKGKGSSGMSSNDSLENDMVSKTREDERDRVVTHVLAGTTAHDVDIVVDQAEWRKGRRQNAGGHLQRSNHYRSYTMDVNREHEVHIDASSYGSESISLYRKHEHDLLITSSWRGNRELLRNLVQADFDTSDVLDKLNSIKAPYYHLSKAGALSGLNNHVPGSVCVVSRDLMEWDGDKKGDTSEALQRSPSNRRASSIFHRGSIGGSKGMKLLVRGTAVFLLKKFF
jgi:hypothetical protein